MVEVHTLPAREAIELKRGDILTRGKLSDATVQTIGVAALDEQACAKPISSECAEALATVTGLPRIDAWLHCRTMAGAGSGHEARFSAASRLA